MSGEPIKFQIEITVGTSLKAIGDEVIRKTIEAHGGSRKKAAVALGITQATILNRLGLREPIIQNRKSAIENSEELARSESTPPDARGAQGGHGPGTG